MSLPEVTSRAQWLEARRRLLAQEKELTRRHDAVNAGLLGGDRSCEMPGYSCFLREGEEIFHTYSVYGRGTEYAGNAYTFLDLTALGRQEDWEEPKGRVAPVRGGDPTFTS